MNQPNYFQVRPLPNAMGMNMGRLQPASPASQATPVQKPRLSEPVVSPKAGKQLEKDAHFKRLTELRVLSGLGNVHASVALPALKASAVQGYHTWTSFNAALTKLMGVPLPEKISREIFSLFDKDKNGKVDYLEIVSGVTVLCAGTETEKLQATFKLVDKNGDGFISMDEMVKFLNSIFRVVLSPGLAASMRSLGVEVEGAADLAAATAIECFKVADLNADGRISFPEFKKWFEAPRRLPTFASIP